MKNNIVNKKISFPILKNIFFTCLVFSFFFLTANHIYAQTFFQRSIQTIGQTFRYFTILSTIQLLMARLIILSIGIAIAVFIFKLLQFLITDSEEKRKNARNTMVYGIIFIFVMVSVWGLVAILNNTFLGGYPNAPSQGGSTINIFNR